MAYARTRYFLISCYLFLTTFTTPRAAALSFDYNFTTPRDREQLKFINASYAGSDRIILTDDRSNLTGRVVHRQPVRLWDDRTGRRASFATSFHFAIVQDNNKTDNLSRGDGMAFFLGPFPATTTPPGSNGGLLGLFSNPNSTGAADSRRPSHTLGVEFDTRWNDGWDPSKEDGAAGGDHIGIDVNGIRSNRTRSLPPLSLHGVMWGIITYDGESKVMKVALRKTELAAESSTTYEFNATMDLRDDAGLVQDAAVGFSAATGVLCESHQLLTWSFHSTDPSRVETKKWVVFLAVTAVLLAGLLVVLLYSTFMQRPKRCLNGNCLQVAKKFAYSELVTATENFSPDRKIGKGSFGDVYRGLLSVPDLREVAVKEMRQPTSKRNRKNYVHEIETLCQLRHKNLLRLIGWCDDGGRLVLVYELEPNGSISDHLHSWSASGRMLTWPQRYKILLGVATAIDYLHNGAYDSGKKYVLHRDIKPSNVMLGEGFEAKLGDFGLVRQVSRNDVGGGTTPRTTVIGSMDYMDPKYIELGTLSAASDIYSFGLVLLEVATGVKPSVQGTSAHRNTLVAAVRESHGRNAILEMVDERLGGEMKQWWWQMECVMVTGLKCVEPERDERPSIKDVIDLLSKHEQSLASNHYLRDSSVRPKDRFRFILTRKAAFANARAWTLAY